MFEEFEALRPLKEAADLLARKAGWPQLYNVKILERNSVPVAGATYYEDMYVDFELAQVCAGSSPLVSGDHQQQRSAAGRMPVHAVWLSCKSRPSCCLQHKM